MPVLELLEPDGSLGVFASVSLLAATMYPDKDDKRDELLFTTAARLLVMLAEAPKKKVKGKKATKDKAVVSIPADWLKVILNSPSADKVIEEAADYAGYSWVAGELILFMLSATIHHPDLNINMTKAVWAMPRLFGGVETFGGGSVSISQRTIWKAWSRFKSVAHLHAVRQIWLQDKDNHTGPDIEGFVNLHNDQLLEFLAISEAIRKAAVERRILKYEETWRPPETLALPPAQAQVPPLPPSALEELAKYAPEHSKDAGLE